MSEGKESKTLIEITVGEVTERRYVESRDYKKGTPESFKKLYKKLEKEYEERKKLKDKDKKEKKK